MSDTTFEIMRGKLTKKFYLQIPTGLFLVSNVCWAPDKPIFAEKVVSQSERENQWKRIVESRVVQRLCHIFADEKDHEKWYKRFHWTKEP
jgi:hypothetical protein